MKLPALYRMVPRNRLLFSAALVLPFALLVPITSPVVALIGFITFGFIAIGDAWMGSRKKAAVQIFLPPIVRLSKDRDSFLPLRIQNPDQTAKQIRIGLPFPAEVQPTNYDHS